MLAVYFPACQVCFSKLNKVHGKLRSHSTSLPRIVLVPWQDGSQHTSGQPQSQFMRFSLKDFRGSATFRWKAKKYRDDQLDEQKSFLIGDIQITKKKQYPQTMVYTL